MPNDAWNSPKWSDRDLSMIKLRHEDERARWDSMMSQIGQAMGLPCGANFMACLERAQELALSSLSFGSDLAGGTTAIDVDAEIELIDRFDLRIETARQDAKRDEILERGSR